MTYTPQPQTAKILDRAWEHVQSVPYQVSLRWLFYRLLQDGIYHSKEDYQAFKSSGGLMSRARKEFYKDWSPWTLADDSRHPIVRHGRFQTMDEWQEWWENIVPDLDEWYGQKNYVEVWFEAKAMSDQFRSIVPRFVTLEPFGGDTSIPEKWAISQRLKEASETYGKPVKVLYFGDFDPKGLTIPRSAVKDILPWSETDFSFQVVGLTQAQAEGLSLPENFEKPGEYQWEALNDQQARKIILTAVKPLLGKYA
jgi:hypothetical protein